MTDEQLNIAVCEWLGWTPCPRCDDPECSYNIRPNHISGIEALGHVHEAEKRLTDEQRRAFVSALHPRSVFNHLDADFEVAHATARQRVIALLRVVKPEIFQ